MKNLIYLLAIPFLACSSTDKPEYVKGIFVRQAGVEGVKFYVVLADKEDKEVSYSGKLTITVDGYTESEKPVTIYDTTYSVGKGDFKANESLPKDSATLSLVTKYLNYDDFKNQNLIKSLKGFVSVKFTPSGDTKVIKGSKSIIFPR